MRFIEKRKMERFSLELPAWVSVTDEIGNQKTIEVLTRNACAGGAYLNMKNPIPVGKDVKINILLPRDDFKKFGGNRSRIDVSGSVIRTDKQGIAVRFDKKYSIMPN